MELEGSAMASVVETTVFLAFFSDMPDHRQAGKVAYPLDEVLLLALFAVLAGAEGFTDIARFGVRKLAFLRRFRPLRLCGILCPGAFCYAIGKRSSNMMASWLLTACHSRTERFHSVEVALSAR